MARVVWSSTHSMCCFVLAHYACCVKTACGECCPQPSSSTDPVLKQPVAKTTHIMCHKQHTGVLNLHPVMCIGVLYCPRCVWDTNVVSTHAPAKEHTMGTLTWVISTWLFLQCVEPTDHCRSQWWSCMCWLVTYKDSGWAAQLAATNMMSVYWLIQ